MVLILAKNEIMFSATMATQVAMPKMIGFKFKSTKFCNSVAMIKVAL